MDRSEGAQTNGKPVNFTGALAEEVYTRAFEISQYLLRQRGIKIVRHDKLLLCQTIDLKLRNAWSKLRPFVTTRKRPKLNSAG